jgi:hypothetical protein
MLREQLLLHQPVPEDNEDRRDLPTLRAELTPKEQPEPQVISQALHIHHHYHAPKKEELRRPKKKRTSLNTTLFTPPKLSQSPRTRQDSTGAILSQTSVTIPAPMTPNNRWSLQSSQMSDFAPSSVPSSPQSMYRHSGLFDRGFDIDSSRPTSPGSSVDPMSPQFQPQYHRKRGSEVSTRSFAAPLNLQPHIIHEEEDGDVDELPDLQTPSMPSLSSDATLSEESQDSEYVSGGNDWTAELQPSLRRCASHESILSISGIDIHTLKSRPSQLTITGVNGLLRPRTRLGTPKTIVSVDTTTSSTMVIAQPTLSRQGHDSTSYLRSSIASNSDARSISSSNSNEGVGSRLGGWVFGRWGVSPAKSSTKFPVDPTRLTPPSVQ